MKALRTSLITAGLLAALATAATTAAFAQPGMGSMSGQEHREGQPAQRTEKMREQMAARHQQRLTDLKTKLQLQPHQENAWTNFAQAMQPPVHPSARPGRVSMQNLSTPERIDQMLAQQDRHAAEMKKRAEATKTFYASLDAAQKNTMDKVSGKWMGSHGDRMGPHKGHPMGQHMGHPMRQH